LAFLLFRKQPCRFLQHFWRRRKRENKTKNVTKKPRWKGKK
jgi:hypothetical protein